MARTRPPTREEGESGRTSRDARLPRRMSRLHFCASLDYSVAFVSEHYPKNMALKATIFKAELQIADMDRGYYGSHAITLARHPSETDERMLVRVLAFCRHANEVLSFTRGLSTDDEPDLWQRDLTGRIEVWIDVGQPDEKRIRKACGRAAQVCIYCHSGHGAELWWQKIRGGLERFDNLTVISIEAAASQSLARLAQRTMQLQCTIQDGQVWLGDADTSVQVDLTVWKQPG
jgi:uncharacterized protein YaeQ